MKFFSHNQQGTITLTVVFLTSMAMLILAFGDHTRVFQANSAARAVRSTEQAFYAAQSCVEEGYLRLRYDAGYRMVDALAVGDSSCTLSVTPDPADPSSGTLTGAGTSGTTVRGVVSGFSGAGPSSTRSETSIMHVLDRTGSMQDDGNGCTVSAYTDAAACAANGGVWGIQPFTSVKYAAKSLNSMLSAAYDRLGLVSYGDSAANVRLDQGMTTDFNTVATAIDGLSAGGATDIGDGVKKAAQTLSTESAGRVRIMIVLTDGVANRPTNETVGAQYARDQAAAAKASPNDILIFTIGLGDTLNEPLMTDMASMLNGVPQYYHAPDASELQEIYAKIGAEIVNYHISQKSWNEQ